MGVIFLKKKSSGPLCGAVGESSSEVLDWPLGTGLSREPLSQTPCPPSGGLEWTPPPPPRTQANFPHALELQSTVHYVQWAAPFDRGLMLYVFPHPKRALKAE